MGCLKTTISKNNNYIKGTVRRNKRIFWVLVIFIINEKKTHFSINNRVSDTIFIYISSLTYLAL